MWPYNRLPADELKAAGFEPDDALIERLERGSVRLNNGGSGSFVSPHGLVMTNHHVASDCIEKLSSAENDYVSKGFYAAEPSEEMKCPDLELNVLMEIENVTEQINKEVTPDLGAAERLEAQRQAQARIEKACQDAGNDRCDVVNLYSGGIFDLYKYRRFTDVRLVFAPEKDIAYFGGDPDNFTYPRYCLDVSFLRVYQGGQPAESPAVLPFDLSGADDGEFVMVSGHPGTTRRLLTTAQLEFERDRRMPFVFDWLQSMAAAVEEYGRQGGEAERLARDELFGLNNSIKAYKGMMAGLRNEQLFEAKQAEQSKLRNAIKENEELEQKFGGAWGKIAQAQATKQKLYEQYRLLEGLGFWTRYFSFARDLHRLAEELQKPNPERLPEYQEARLESLYQQLYSTAPVYPELEQVKLAASLEFLKEKLGAEHPAVKAALDGRNPEEAATELIEGSRLDEVEFRKELGAEDAGKTLESEDPLLQLVAAIDDEARKVRKQYEDEVEAVENAQGSEIAQARFGVFGTDVYPDATFTLRLAFGRVKGYEENGRQIPPFTRYKGLYERATGDEPYILPESFERAKERLDLETPLNLVSTNDITGGNSGSPVLDVEGRVVGLIFDGNIQSLPNSLLYSEVQARAVSVDVRGIVEALEGVYQAERLVSELRSAAKAAER